MCMTFHVHERNNDSEKAQFSHRQFEKRLYDLESINMHKLLGVFEDTVP